MTEKKKLPEQRGAYIYRGAQKGIRRSGGLTASSVYSSRRQSRADETSRSSELVPRALKRVVTVPQEADPSAAWQTFAQRQEKLRRHRSRPQKQRELVARTFKQTGVRASSGRIQAVRRPLPYYSSIPTRSGRRRTRRALLWKLLLVIVGLLAIILLLNFLLSSPIFRLQKVNVIGTQNTALVRNIQKMDIVGQNIFLLNVSGLRAHIESSPLVSSAEVSKQWPDQLTITIVESKAVLLWQTPQGIFSVDQSGKIVSRVDSTAGTSQLGTVIDQTPQTAEPQMRPGAYLKHMDISFAHTILQRVTKVTGIDTFKLYYDGTMYASTTNPFGGDADRRGSYIIESPDGWKAYLGGASDPNPLDNRLLEIRDVLKLAQQQKQQVATIDVRYGLHPVFTVYK